MKHPHCSLPAIPRRFLEQVADWEELRRRKDLDLLQAYPAGGLHPSTFVPTNQVAAVGPDGSAGTAAAMPLPLPLAMVPAGATMGVVGVPGGVPLVPALPTAAPVPLPAAEPRGGVRTVGKVTKASKSKAGGRTFTSKYRGVHQTFPTRRWEAQFRWVACPAAWRAHLPATLAHGRSRSARLGGPAQSFTDGRRCIDGCRRVQELSLSRWASVCRARLLFAAGLHAAGAQWPPGGAGPSCDMPPRRRNGKPTSLGCFDHEEQAARAYDKMMLWCELHNAAGVKGGITNFDPSGGAAAGFKKAADAPPTWSVDCIVDYRRGGGCQRAAGWACAAGCNAQAAARQVRKALLLHPHQPAQLGLWAPLLRPCRVRGRHALPAAVQPG